MGWTWAGLGFTVAFDGHIAHGMGDGGSSDGDIGTWLWMTEKEEKWGKKNLRSSISSPTYLAT